ncbi:hypothetical protein ACQE3E_20645 [Methylomonas sp. MED-D]|nr:MULTISPECIES: hypothetical protein [Methylomonas]MDT4332144.1 hypothetical protein [Methylomonas sp. MV1]NJA04308.1 hypothetical protein [Methylococcaceae bacterium WWC4]WGS85685.1 hypothetical protein QC632_22035 [Methylomonas sp. UP202]
MIRHTVHMRDQKANQVAMLNRVARQSAINMLEEITLVIVLWGVFLLATG